MNWIDLTSASQLEDIKKLSASKAQFIFKHSTRCSISAMAKGRLERSTVPANIDFYYLDLLSYRDLSNKIAEDFDVYHESPQALLICNGACVFAESHSGIQLEEFVEQAEINITEE